MHNKSTCRKLFWLISMPVVAAINVAMAQEKPIEKTTTENQVVLKIAVVASAPKTTLAFIVTNNGKTELRTSTFAATWNRIVVSDPDGKTVEVYDRVMEIEPTIIKPSESKTWKVEISPVLETLKLEKPGVYKLYWKLRDITTDDTDFKYKSDEFFLLKENVAQKK